MKTVLTVLVLSTVVACGKKVEAVVTPPVAEPAKVEAVKDETKPLPVAGVQAPVVVEVVDAGVVLPAPVESAPPASPVK